MKRKTKYKMSEVRAYDSSTTLAEDEDGAKIGKSVIRRLLLYAILATGGEGASPMDAFICALGFCFIWNVAGRRPGFLMGLFQISSLYWVITLSGINNDLLLTLLLAAWVCIDVVPFCKKHMKG